MASNSAFREVVLVLQEILEELRNGNEDRSEQFQASEKERELLRDAAKEAQGDEKTTGISNAINLKRMAMNDFSQGVRGNVRDLVGNFYPELWSRYNEKEKYVAAATERDLGQIMSDSAISGHRYSDKEVLAMKNNLTGYHTVDWEERNRAKSFAAFEGEFSFSSNRASARLMEDAKKESDWIEWFKIMFSPFMESKAVSKIGGMIPDNSVKATMNRSKSAESQLRQMVENEEMNNPYNFNKLRNQGD